MIAAFDLASTVGGCDGEVGGTPRVWSWHLRDAGKSRPARLLMLRRFLMAYFDEPGPQLTGVVYEAPLPLAVMMKIGASDDTVALLRGLVGVLEMSCEERGVPVEPVPVQDARHSVLGWRRNPSGGRTKSEVMRM